MSADYSKDLEKWVPHLLAMWRKNRKGTPGPATHLSGHELKEVAAGVRQLSMGLTRDRELAGAKYLDDPKLLGAYLLFYWPVSYAQARQALGEISARPRTAIDLGSGPGPLGFAAMDSGAGQVICADRSKAALVLARDLAMEGDEALATREWDPMKNAPIPPGPYDLITMGHLINELYGTGPGAIAKRAELVEQGLTQLKPGGSLLIIEPALRETSRNLLLVRDALVAKGYAVRAPCMWQGNCPALIKETDWCHAERNWKMPKLVEDIARAASLHKESLKMSYVIFAPKSEAWRSLPAGRLFRIVSEPLPGKGRHRYIGCGPEGRIGLAMQEKHRNAGNESFFSLDRGDVISITSTEEKGDGLGLNDQTEVKRIARAGWDLPKP